ncbi:hypothetical protein [Pseudidiomarina sp.]|uniref:hypothetical protein n=1 Tax=Pseudidiomarina sp. TaxID=2081707 RepID=UPI003A97A2A6
MSKAIEKRLAALEQTGRRSKAKRTLTLDDFYRGVPPDVGLSLDYFYKDGRK